MKNLRNTSAVALAAAAALVATGCASSSPDSAGADATPTAAVSSAATQAAAISLVDPWVKAAADGMTAAFGTLVNSSSEPITVVSAASDITDAMELHETVQNGDGSMAMQPKAGGFTVDASGQRELAPGGDHLMIMNLTRPVEAGEQVTLTLTMTDGSAKDVSFTVKNFTGAEEKYQNGDDMQMDKGMAGHGGM